MLTPLKKYDFGNVENVVSIVSFLSRTSLNLISSPFLTENKSRQKIAFFDQKHGLTPFGKVRFLRLENFDFTVKKSFFFHLEYH